MLCRGTKNRFITVGETQRHAHIHTEQTGSLPHGCITVARAGYANKYTPITTLRELHSLRYALCVAQGTLQLQSTTPAILTVKLMAQLDTDIQR